MGLLWIPIVLSLFCIVVSLVVAGLGMYVWSMFKAVGRLPR
jgi:hypothetical protein